MRKETNDDDVSTEFFNESRVTGSPFRKNDDFDLNIHNDPFGAMMNDMMRPFEGKELIF